MKSCALGLAIDGSKGNLISCFKEGKKCEIGGPSLQNQMLPQQDKEIEKDPFTVSEEDITEAAPFFDIIEEDDVERDTNIKTELFFCHNVANFHTVSYVFFYTKDTVILHPRITHLLSCFCHFF